MVSLVFVLLVTFAESPKDSTGIAIFDTFEACTWVAGAMNTHQGNVGTAFLECQQVEVTDV